MNSQILKKPLPYLALIIANLIWGANFVVAKITLEEFPPMSLAFLRFALACIFLTPFVLVQINKIRISPKDLPKLAAAGIFIVSLNITFFFEGMIRTSAINASVLSLLVPILSVLLGWIMLKEKVYLINLGGAGIGLIGAMVIIGIPQLISGSYSTQALIGNLLIILAAVSFVSGAIFCEKMLKKYSTLTVTSIAFLVGTVTFFFPALREYLLNPAWIQSVSLIGILGVVYMTLLSSISAYFLFEWGLSQTDVARADLIQYIEPFIAAFLAVNILGERISPSFLAGSLLIAIGVFLGTFSKEAHHRHHKPHRI